MRFLTLAGILRLATTLTIVFTGIFGSMSEAASAPTGQPVVYALTPKNTITVIDTGNNQILNTITQAGSGEGEQGGGGFIVGTPDGKTLYVTGNDPTNTQSETGAVVFVIDTQTNLVKTTIPLDLFAAGMVISGDGSRVYVATTLESDGAGDVEVIDTASNAVIAKVPSSTPSTSGIAISPNGQRVYVPQLGDKAGQGALDVINTTTDTLTTSPIVDSSSVQYYWAAVSPDSTKLFTSLYYTDNSSGNTVFGVVVFDTSTNKQTNTAPIPNGGVLSTPLPNSSIIYGKAGGSVLAYNVQTNKVTASVPVAASISELALTPNGKQLYVSNSNTNSIAIIDTATNALSGSVAVAGATNMTIVAAPPPLVLTPPVVTLQLALPSVPPKSQDTLSWTSTGATSCTGSDAWSGSVALQGETAVSSANVGTHIYTLTCTGPGGMASASASLTVIPGSTLSANATDISSGSSAVLSWRSFSGATGCSLNGGAISADVATSGSMTVGPLFSTTVFTLDCAGSASHDSTSVSISVYTPAPLTYTSLAPPPNNNVYALGTPGTADIAGGLDGHGYTFDSQALPNPLTAFGQIFTIGTASKPSGNSSQSIALTPAQLQSLTLLETAVNGNQLNQPFVVTYSDGTKTTYTQSLTDWGSSTSLPGEAAEPIQIRDRLTATGAKQLGNWTIHAFSIPLDITKVATTLQLPKNRNVIVLAINESKAAQVSREDIAPAFNVTGLASVGHASPSGRLDGHGYAFDGALLPSGFSGAGQQFTMGPVDQVNAVSNSTITFPAKTRRGLTVLAAAVDGSQPNQMFVVTYQDGTTTSFTQSVSDWGQAQHYAGETIARSSASRITPTGVLQAGSWDVYAYSFQTDPSKEIVSLTLPRNRNVVVFAVNSQTQ